MKFGEMQELNAGRYNIKEEMIIPISNYRCAYFLPEILSGISGILNGAHSMRQAYSSKLLRVHMPDKVWKISYIIHLPF